MNRYPCDVGASFLDRRMSPPRLLLVLIGFGIATWVAPGQEWMRHPLRPTPGTLRIHDLAAIGEEMFAVGEFGTFQRLRASEWEMVASPTTEQFEIVWGLRCDDVYAATRSGLVLRFDGNDLKPVGDRIQILQPGQKDYPIRPSFGWASSPRNIYLAADPAGLVQFDGARWSEVDVGARSLTVRGASAKGIERLLPRIGPIWGTSDHDVWVRVEILDAQKPRHADHVVKHFDGTFWIETPVRLPANSPDSRQPVPDVVQRGSDPIWTRFEGALHRWNSGKCEWTHTVALPAPTASVHWATWTAASRGAVIHDPRAGWRRFRDDRWEELPVEPPAECRDPPKVVMTDGGRIGVLVRHAVIFTWTPGG